MGRDSYYVKGLRECLRNDTARLRAFFDKSNQKNIVVLVDAHNLDIMTAGRFFAEENSDNDFFAEIYSREGRGAWFN